MKYLHWFETEGKYEEKRYGDYIEPWTSFVMESERVDYNMDDEEKLLSTPLTFEMMGDGTIWWTTQGDDVTRTIEYRKNGGEWISITSSTVETETSTINVASGDIVEFRGDNSNYGNGYTAGGHQRRGNFRTAVPFKAYGNVMSLVNSSRFMTIKAIDGSNTSMFSYLFSNCSGLTDISQLLLPVTEMKIGNSVASMCYYSMFENCYNLTGAPIDLLPATVLSN